MFSAFVIGKFLHFRVASPIHRFLYLYYPDHNVVSFGGVTIVLTSVIFKRLFTLRIDENHFS